MDNNISPNGFFFCMGLFMAGSKWGGGDCCPVWLSGCKHHTCCWRSTWDVFLLCFKGMFGSLGDTPIHPGLLMKNKSVWLEFNLQNSEFCTIKQFKKERLYVVLCTFLVITKTCCFFSLSFFFLETFWRVFADEEWSLQEWHGSQFPLRHRCKKSNPAFILCAQSIFILVKLLVCCNVQV